MQLHHADQHMIHREVSGLVPLKRVQGGLGDDQLVKVQARATPLMQGPASQSQPSPRRRMTLRAKASSPKLITIPASDSNTNAANMRGTCSR